MNFNQYLLENESHLRLGVFLGLFIMLALLELVMPKRELAIKKSSRWLNNLILLCVNTFLLRVLLPAAAVVVASYAMSQQLGLLNLVALPSLLSITVGVILLDFIIYWQHRMVHKVPIFWRLHAVHHCDKDIDVTTAIRFHPLEIILSMLIKCGCVFVLGVPVIAVVLFEILLNGFAMFNHANLSLFKKLDAILKKMFVTPDMHHIHHSTDYAESNSNYGFMLSIWDKLFDSYRSELKVCDKKAAIGLDEYRDNSQVISFFSLLKMPLYYKPSAKNNSISSTNSKK